MNSNDEQKLAATRDLQPLPEAHLIAAELERKAGELLLIARRLRDSCPLPERPKKVEFLFSMKKGTGKNTKKKSQKKARNKS